jgi:hypothetical protein
MVAEVGTEVASSPFDLVTRSVHPVALTTDAVTVHRAEVVIADAVDTTIASIATRGCRREGGGAGEEGGGLEGATAWKTEIQGRALEGVGTAEEVVNGDARNATSRIRWVVC